MSKTRKHSERAEPLGESQGWVDVFASGTHRDKKYPPAAILKMAQNFKKLSTGNKPLLTVPAVVGHDEDQKFLNDSGWPAAGWPKKVRVVDDSENPGEKKLQAIIGEIPPKLAEAINNKSYRKVSAEVYDDFVDPRTGEHHGPTLRRIAFLGGEIPQVKTLDDLPKVGYREEGGTFVAFMERHADTDQADPGMGGKRLKELKGTTTIGTVTHNDQTYRISAKPNGGSRGGYDIMISQTGKTPQRLTSLGDEYTVQAALDFIRDHKLAAGSQVSLPSPKAQVQEKAVDVAKAVKKAFAGIDVNVTDTGDGGVKVTFKRPNQDAARGGTVGDGLVRQGFKVKYDAHGNAYISHAETMSPELREADKPAAMPDKEKGQLQEDLIKKGFDAKLLKDIPDVLLAEITRIVTAQEPEADQPQPESAPAGNAPGGEQPMPKQSEAQYGNAPNEPNPTPGASVMAADNPGEEIPGTPDEEKMAPRSGPSGIQPEALDEGEIEPHEPGEKEFKPEQMEDEDMYAEFDEEDADKKMSSYADFHKQAARHYATKYADTDDSDAKKTFAAKASFHRGMAAKYDDNRQFPERTTPKPAAQEGSQARPVEAAAKHAERLIRKYVEPRLQQMERRQAATQRKDDRMTVTAFCENLCRQGRMYAAEKETRIMELMLLDNSQVRKFKEGGNVFQATPRQLVMARMAKGPVVVKLGERFKEPGRNVGSGVDKFAERGSKLNQFWERFGEELESHGEKYADWEALVKNPNISDAEAERILQVG